MRSIFAFALLLGLSAPAYATVLSDQVAAVEAARDTAQTALAAANSALAAAQANDAADTLKITALQIQVTNQQAQIAALQAQLAAATAPPIVIPPPYVTTSLSVKDFGAQCDGKTDDQSGLQKAFDAGKAQGKPVKIEGTCLHSGVLTVTATRVFCAVTTSGLRSVNDMTQALYIKGDGAGLYNCKITSPGTKRTEGDGGQNPVYIDHATNFAVENNEFTGGGSATILNDGGTGGVIRHNWIHDTFKDCIHNKNGASGTLIEYNKIFHCGDDGVAVVAYGNAPAAIPHDITIQFNENIESKKGRGFTVVGGRAVKLLNNYVKAMHYGDLTRPGGLAGIYIAGESGDFNTAPAHDVLSQGNIIIASGGPPTGHGAWMLYNDDMGHVGNDLIVSKGDIIAGPLGPPVVVNGPYKGQLSISGLTVYWSGAAGTEIADQTVPHQITRGTITSKPLASFVDPGGIPGAGLDPAYVPPPLR